MAQKSSDAGGESIRSQSQSFTEFLSGCPSIDEPGAAGSITVVGVVMRTGKEGRFAVRTQDEAVHEIPVEAIESFSALGSSPSARFAQLQLNPARLVIFRHIGASAFSA